MDSRRPPLLAAVAVFAACTVAKQPVPPSAPATEAAGTTQKDSEARPPGRFDAQTKLVWSEQPGAPTLDWADAKAWCEGQPDGPWRLPSKWELRSMLSPDGFAYRAEFADFAKMEGYIFSSEQVSAERSGEPWVLNLRNGVIFNGAEQDAMPWCVSGAPFTWSPVERPASYDDTILGAPGGVEIELKCQFDHTFCKAAYDRLAKLGDKVHVRLRHSLPWKRLYERQVVACVAAVQGQLPRMAQMLFANAKTDPEAEDPYVYAEQMGLDMTRVDADAEELCPRIIEDDEESHKRLDRPPVKGLPSAFANGVVFDGKQIGEGALEELVGK